MRWLAIWLPELPLFACAAPVDVPVAISDQGKLICVNSWAQHSGVQAGMRTTQAEILCPGLQVLSPQPAKEEELFTGVIACLQQVLASIWAARLDLVLTPVKPGARYWGGEAQLADKVSEALAVNGGVPALLGIADGTLAAVLAAHSGVIIPKGQSQNYLQQQPVTTYVQQAFSKQETQEIAELVLCFQQLGLVTIGDLLRLPLAQVNARFGPMGARLYQLGQGKDRVFSSRPVASPPPQVYQEYAPALQRLDSALFAAQSLVTQFQAELHKSAVICTEISIELATAAGVTTRRHWALPDGGQGKELRQKIQWHVEGWHSRAGNSTGGITSLRLLAITVLPVLDAQPTLDKQTNQGELLAKLGALRLQEILGEAAVYRPCLQGGFDPRGQIALRPWSEILSAGALPEDCTWPGSLSAPWPATLLQQPIQVYLQDSTGQVVLLGEENAVPKQKPAQLTFPATSSTALPAGLCAAIPPGTYALKRLAGPWPVNEFWWREPQSLNKGATRWRAYVQVEISPVAPLLLLYQSQQWWLEGVYD